MSETTFDSVTRQVADAVSRRKTLTALGSAALLATVAGVQSAEAGKAARKANKKCKKQQGQCRSSVEQACGDNSECLDALLPCCTLFKHCKARAAIDCVIAVL